MEATTGRTAIRAAWLAGVATYLLVFRLYDVSHSFALLSEQVRDWSTAQLPFAHLPLAGPRSVNSGLDIGPVYYWFLWLARVVVGPFFGNMPHAGAWAISLFQTVADLVLLAALGRRLGSWPLAAFAILLLGTSPVDAALNASVWNPPVSLAFTKLALAGVLAPAPISLTRAVMAVFAGWAAVQCHVSAVLPVAVVLIVAMCRTWGAHGRRGAALVAAAALVLTAATVAPYLVRPATDVSAAGGGVGGSLAAVLQDPLSRIRPTFGLRAVGAALALLFTSPFAAPHVGWLLFAAAAATVGLYRRDRVLASIAAGPLAVAVCAFAAWQGASVEAYWVLVIGPSAAIAVAFPFAALDARSRRAATAGLWIGLAALQPARATEAWTAYRLPSYGPLVEGARAAAAREEPVRAVRPGFTVPEGMDPEFLYRLAGGRLEPGAPETAIVQSDGSVQYRPAP